MEKRGISPLIATVLLVAFVVVVAAAIFTWGQGWFSGLLGGTSESTNLQVTCVQDGGLTISDVCDVGDGNTRFTIINTGTMRHALCTISGGGTSIDCGALAPAGVGSYSLAATLDAGDVASTVFILDTDIGNATCQGSQHIVPAGGLKGC